MISEGEAQGVSLTGPAELIYSLALKDARPSGVLDTLESRLEGMQSVLPGSYGLCFYRGEAPESGRYKRITFVRVRARSRETFHLFFPLYLWRWLRASDARPRHVVVRHHFPSPLFGLLFRKRKFTLVSEHHTDLEANLSTLPGFFGKILPLVSRIFRPTTDCVIDGKIGLTREVLGTQADYPSVIITGNGINPQERSNQTYQVFDGHTLNVVTIISAGWRWYGLERMITSMESWANQNPRITFNLSIIGPRTFIHTTPNVGIGVHLLGPKTPREISRLVGSFNFAFSSMATWSMGLHEACPLKSRTYIGLGIPYISAYVDPDLDDSRLFVERFPNSPEKISWADLQPFLDRLNGSRNKVLKDLSEARSELSHVTKAADLQAFLSRLRSAREVT